MKHNIAFRITNVKPISINIAYYKTRKVLSLEGRRFRKRLLLSINHNKEIIKSLRDIRDTFDKHKHYLDFDITILIPKDKFYTNKGYISRQSGDLDNFLKLLTDFICNEKNAGLAFSGGKHPEITNLSLDDQFICDYMARKRPSFNNSYHIDISIQIRDLNELEDHLNANEELSNIPSFDYHAIINKYSR